VMNREARMMFYGGIAIINRHKTLYKPNHT
jgi:hypothetical protein